MFSICKIPDKGYLARWW